MLEIPLWRGGAGRRSLEDRTLLDYRAEPVARVHVAPALLVHRAVAELRRAAPLYNEDPAELWPVIARAGRLLATGDLGGCSAAEHAELTTRATGAPLTWATTGLVELARGMEQIEEALRRQAPGGDLSAFRTRRVGSPGHAWVPVGQVLGFVAPSNHPAVHLTWVLALAMGWCVAIRPGADDPLTPWRALLALKEVGFPIDRVAFLPGDHELVPALVEACDRTVAYGGESLARLLGNDPRVLFNGPGHSKVLVDGALVAESTPTFLLDCILHDGGRKCTCASSIILRGEAPGLLDDLAERLAAVPLLDPLDPAARIPAWKVPSALRATPATPVEADGLYFARPALIRCSGPESPPFGIELPTAWATALTLPADADPLPVLRGSLAVSLLTADRPLIERCLLEPAITKLFVGPIPPWYTEPGAPHHGLLADFLFTAKAFKEVHPWN